MPDHKLKEKYRHQYYLKHSEEEKANQIQYYKKHRKEILANLRTPEAREKRRPYEQQYIAKNRAKRQSYMQAYQQRPKVKEHRRIKQLRSRNEHREEVREKARAYLAIPEVHERYLAHYRKFRRSEKGRTTARYYNERRREWKLGLIESYTRAEFLKKLRQTNGLCPMCKQPFTKGYHSRHELTIDHNPPVSKAPKGFVYTIKDIQLICLSCNAKKGNKGF